MKRFNFSLQILLDSRKSQEEKERNELGRLTSLLVESKRRLESLKERQHCVLKELADLQHRGEESTDFALFCTYLERLKVEFNRTLEDIRELERRIEAQKVVVVEATKRRKLLEALRARKQREHLAAVESEEQKMVDETVVVGYSRKAN